MIDLKAYAVTGVLATVLASAGPVLAQTARQAAPPAGDPQASALEDVVVTARRREENLQDVPLSVTAYSSEALSQRRIADRTELANFTPSLVTITGGYPKEFAFFALRGQGPAFGSTPGVINYFAEVPNAIGIDGRTGSYYDLASVQVLAGPQGTLFGKNATGGNILFEPQRPTNTFGGYVQGEIGNYDDRRAEFALNLPIVQDKVLFRVAGETGRRDGYTVDVGPNFNGKDYDNLDYSSARASLIVRPTDRIELYTVARYFESSNNGSGAVLTQFNPTLGVSDGAPAFAVFPGLATAVADQAARGPRRVAYDLDQYSRTRAWQILNHASFNLTDTLTLKNIISYSEFESRYGYDYDATIYPIAGQTSRDLPTQSPTYFTEELQLQGTAFENVLNFTTGVYYDKQDLSDPQGGLFTQYPISLFLGPIPAVQTVKSDSHAVFAQGTLDLGKLGLPEGLSLTGGYRYTWESTETSTQIFILPTVSGAADFEYGSYNLSLDYQISPDVHVYGTVRDAYKAGGVNGPVPAGDAFATFPPEKLEDVEVGVKSQFRVGGTSVRANLAIYRGDYTNIQRTSPEFIGGTILNVTRSAAEGRVQGAEFTGAIVPLPGLTFTGSFSYIDAEYTKVADASAGALLAGAQFPYTPKTKFSLGVNWDHSLGRIGELGLSANYADQSSFSTAQNNLAQVRSLPGYNTLNLRAALRQVGGKPVDVIAFVANATDETFATGLADFYNSGGGALTYTYGEPRTYGLQVRYSF
jgi:iron complex outermembrane receptor protein